MIKKLAIVAAVMSLGCSAMAQEGGSSTGLSTNNKIQVSLLLGNSPVIAQNQYILPNYTVDANGIGNTIGVNPDIVLNLNNLGGSSLVNIAGIQFGYYLNDDMEINAMFGMNISSTPKKDIVEGVAASPAVTVPAQIAIDGEVSNSWISSVGFNYHFSTSNDKVGFYAGAQLGYQQSRISADYAWNGDINAYRPVLDKGQLRSMSIGAVAGVSYNFVPGFSLGIEAAPVSYYYNAVEIVPSGLSTFKADNKAVRFLSSPMLKLGIRF